MRATRRTFLQSAATAPLLGSTVPPASLPPTHEIARRHAITRNHPTPNFFEGMLLGNGDIGLCVTVRPDALGLHIGKLDVWDIRVSEDHVKHLLPFAELLKLWQRASDEAKREGKPDAIDLESGPVMKEYTDKMRSSYAESWPRPWPCGSVWLHWDPRMVSIARQRLDIATGLYTLDLDCGELRGPRRRVTLRCFVNWNTGHINVASDGAVAPVTSIAYDPNIDRKARLPLPEVSCRTVETAGEFSCYQHFPAIAPTAEVPDPPPSPNDRNFALCGRLAGKWAAEAGDGRRAWLTSDAEQPLRLDLALFTPLDVADNVKHAGREAERLSALPVARLREETAAGWRKFWAHSTVELEDTDLERIWYHNQYFLACCLREGKVAPGLFGNWSSGNIGTAWHGDYHMNYNTQQVFWGVFSSNHVEQHLPYVKLVENLMPIAEWNARVQFGLPGAYFPHSAYPVPSKVNAYPVAPWGYEICETPWTVQSLWWQYLYTLDRDYLRRVYPMLKGATDFLAAFFRKGSDGKYHVSPTVSPENWGMTVDFRLNRDCIIDIALTEFLLDAMIEASKVLDADADLRPRWSEMRHNMAPYPAADGPFGRVWLDVKDAPLEHVYNVPVTIAPVFPAEQVGIGRREESLELARRTTRAIRLEGGNDLVWQPLVRARLGLLDLDWFKREVRYCLLPNGVANDRARQIGGRYSDRTSFDFMMNMGIWTENLSLPVVLNECMMQSYTGVIRLFPNTKNLGKARFANLRAAGAFLVSAAWDGATVAGVEILSEKGAEARLLAPWSAPVRVESIEDSAAAPHRMEGREIRFATKAGGRYRVKSA